jgi:hypothetical protein
VNKADRQAEKKRIQDECFHQNSLENAEIERTYREALKASRVKRDASIKTRCAPIKAEECVAWIYGERDWSGHECINDRGKGKDGLYCGVHARQYPA